MSIRDELQNKIKEAMRARQSDRLTVLRMLTAALKQIEIDQKKEITDSVVLDELARQVKQRRGAAEQYEKAGRKDLAEKEYAEIGIIQEFLPVPLDEEEIIEKINEVLKKSGLARDRASMSSLMSQLQAELKGRADMALVSRLVRDMLNNG